MRVRSQGGIFGALIVAVIIAVVRKYNREGRQVVPLHAFNSGGAGDLSASQVSADPLRWRRRESGASTEIRGLRLD
jgi:hypothetical protein